MNINLNINLNKKINKPKLLKNNKFKYILGATLILSTLTSCNNNNITPSKDYSTSIETTTDENYLRNIEINFNNYNQNISDNEFLEFKNKDNVTYNIVKIPNDGYLFACYDEKNSTIYSSTINKEVKLPVTDENENTVITIDYATNDISVEIIPLNYSKAK